MGFIKAQITEILDKLEAQYPKAECALDFGSLFQLLISVVLSAQTTDKSVNLATPKLFQRYPDAESLALAPREEIQEIIRPIGMYKTKTKNIIGMSKILVEKYNGQVPGDYDKLVEFPGVGRKSANVVLSVGFGQQRIAVDTHVFRVSNRIGLVREKDVLKTELALMKALPEDRWSRSHHSLIFHGRNCCHARKPQCDICVINHLCKKRG